MIETNDLSKQFSNNFWAVDGVTLTVQPGQILALLGQNGAGKTTTVRMLTSLLTPTRGWARVAGYDVIQHPQKVRSNVGVLTEQHGLYMRMSGEEYLDYFGRVYGLENQVRRARSAYLLEYFGLAEAARRRCGEYSKGMKQKLALARALMHNPSVLLLDEPTSAMDPESARLVRDEIIRLRSTQRTIIICTHNLVRAEKSLTNGLRLVKEFQLSTYYLIHATVRLENTSAFPLTLSPQSWVVGTATPMGLDDDGQNVGLMWYDGSRKEKILKPWFDNASFFSCIGLAARQPRPEYSAGSSNVFWASAQNQFFALVAMPGVPAQQIVSRPVPLPRPALDELPPNFKNAPPPQGFLTLLNYPDVTLAPGQALERPFDFFAGPKEYRTLARIADRFQNNVDSIMAAGETSGSPAKRGVICDEQQRAAGTNPITQNIALLIGEGRLRRIRVNPPGERSR